MIKDVMVRLDGTTADATRLAAAEYISGVFDGHIIGIFLNVLPLIVPVEGDKVAAATPPNRCSTRAKPGTGLKRFSFSAGQAAKAH
jgi:hypothetical protein